LSQLCLVGLDICSVALLRETKVLLRRAVLHLKAVELEWIAFEGGGNGLGGERGEGGVGSGGDSGISVRGRGHRHKDGPGGGLGTRKSRRGRLKRNVLERERKREKGRLTSSRKRDVAVLSGATTTLTGFFETLMARVFGIAWTSESPGDGERAGG
jgi:hypothetical protein